MMDNKRITIMADTVVNEEKIATYGAILNMETGELSLSYRNINNEACKEHRNVVRDDRAEFEDLAYKLQDMLKA